MNHFLLALCASGTGYFGLLVFGVAFREKMTRRLLINWAVAILVYLLVGHLLLALWPHIPQAILWIPAVIFINAEMAKKLLSAKLPLTITIALFLDAVVRLIAGLWGLAAGWLLKVQFPYLLRRWPLFNWQTMFGLVLGLPTVILLGMLAHRWIQREQMADFFAQAQTDIYDVILVVIFFVVYLVFYYFGLQRTLVWQAYLATVFSVSFGILDIYLVFNKNKRLSDHRLMQEVEQYSALLGQRNEQLHNFNHDYQNILLNMSQYIKNSDLQGLKNYYEHQVDRSILGKGSSGGPEQLRLIADPAIVGLIYSKYEQAHQRGVNLLMTITAKITIKNHQRVNLVRIIGNLLDNAIDAASEADQRVILLIENLPHSVVRISISNQIPATEKIDLSKITKNRFTTKQGHFGYGLSSIQQLSNRKIHVDYQINAQVFMARLVIKP